MTESSDSIGIDRWSFECDVEGEKPLWACSCEEHERDHIAHSVRHEKQTHSPYIHKEIVCKYMMERAFVFHVDRDNDG